MPHFKLEVAPAVKKEQGWEVTALATVLYGNRPPDPPEEVVFDVNGEEFERTETNPESGIARSVMILQGGGFVVTAYRPRARADDRDARRTRSFAIREERELTESEKKLTDLKAKTKVVEAEKELKKAQEEPDPDELALKSEQTRLERAKVSRELKEVIQEKPKKPGEEELEAERIQLERARVARELKEVTEGKPKIPRRLSVTVSGERGRQKLLISVSAEDGSLMPGFVGTIQEPSGVTSYTTSDNGTVVHEVNFEEPSRPIEIRAGNHPDLVWRARILGPRKE